MKCRVCGSESANELGKYSPYLDYEATVFRCGDCKCHFTLRDESVYERLHSGENTGYGRHNTYAKSVHSYFSAEDLTGLEGLLQQDYANAFVVNGIKALANKNSSRLKILELGCSKGYLGAYSIAAGHEYKGVDISETAVIQARNNFGDFFYSSMSSLEDQMGSFDVVYHVGTIGCVESPLAFLNENINYLKPGGTLLFNAPNVRACRVFNELWVTQTHPPDLVTLFDRNVLLLSLGKICEMNIQERQERPAAALRKLKSKLLRRSSLYSPKRYLFKREAYNLDAADEENVKESVLIVGLKRCVLALTAKILGRRIPAEFGLLIDAKKL